MGTDSNRETSGDIGNVGHLMPGPNAATKIGNGSKPVQMQRKGKRRSTRKSRTVLRLQVPPKGIPVHRIIAGIPTKYNYKN